MNVWLKWHSTQVVLSQAEHADPSRSLVLYHVIMSWLHFTDDREGMSSVYGRRTWHHLPLRSEMQKSGERARQGAIDTCVNTG